MNAQTLEALRTNVAFLRTEGYSREDIARVIDRHKPNLYLTKTALDELHRKDLLQTGKFQMHTRDLWPGRCEAIAELARKVRMKKLLHGIRRTKNPYNLTFLYGPQTGDEEEKEVVEYVRQRAGDTARVVEYEVSDAPGEENQPRADAEAQNAARHERTEAALDDLCRQLSAARNQRNVGVECARYVIANMHYLGDVEGVDLRSLSPSLLRLAADRVSSACDNARKHYTQDDLRTGVLAGLLGDAGYALGDWGLALHDPTLVVQGLNQLAEALAKQGRHTEFSRLALRTELVNSLVLFDKCIRDRAEGTVGLPERIEQFIEVAATNRGEETRDVFEAYVDDDGKTLPLGNLVSYLKARKLEERLRTAMFSSVARLLAFLPWIFLAALLLIPATQALAGAGIR